MILLKRGFVGGEVQRAGRINTAKFSGQRGLVASLAWPLPPTNDRIGSPYLKQLLPRHGTFHSAGADIPQFPSSFPSGYRDIPLPREIPISPDIAQPLSVSLNVRWSPYRSCRSREIQGENDGFYDE
jgi:hypothetical protein